MASNFSCLRNFLNCWLRLFSVIDFAFEAETRGDNRSCKAENFLPLKSAFCSSVFLPSEESWMTSAPLVLKASEIRFPAIAAPPVAQKSDKTKILFLIRYFDSN